MYTNTLTPAWVCAELACWFTAATLTVLIASAYQATGPAAILAGTILLWVTLTHP